MIFGSDNSIENIQQLAQEIRKLVKLQVSYAKLELTEKLTVLLSTLVLVLVVIILSMVALFYLSFTLVYILAPHVGGLVASFGIVTLLIVVLIAGVFAFRRKLIFEPMVKFLASLFLSTDQNNSNETGNTENTQQP